MTSRYNPDDYDRIPARGIGADVCDGCAFDGKFTCSVSMDKRFDCSLFCGDEWVDYIFVVKNAKADEKGGK